MPAVPGNVEQQQPSDLRRLLGLSRRHLRAFVAATICSVVSVLCGLGIPVITQYLVDHAIAGGDTSLLWPLGFAALGLGALQALTIFLRRNLGRVASVAIETDLRSRLFAHLQAMPLSFHQQWRSGQLLARATSDLNAVSGFFGDSLVFLTFFAVTLTGVFVMLILLDLPLALLVFALIAPSIVLVRQFDARMRLIARRSRQEVGEVTGVVQDTVGGMRTLKAFGRTELAVDRVRDAAQRLRGVNLEAVGVQSWYVSALALLPAIALAVVLGVGGFRVLDGGLTVGALIAATQYLNLALGPLDAAGMHLVRAQQAAAAGHRVLEILDTPPTLADEPGAAPLAPATGEVRFDDVSFSYPGATAPALAGISFTVRAGETVALVGRSGAGKSTLAALLCRFADPGGGRVLIDGTDIKTVTIASVRRQLGVVFDEPMLFAGTVGDNVAFSDPDASAEAVRRAAEQAGAHGFISARLGGYDAVVTERGLSLSGGQRQRVALARALLGRPPILVLDDPLSNVDAETRAGVEGTLRALAPRPTTLVIARNASTVALADRVVLLDAGRVLMQGRHEELLAEPAYTEVMATELGLDAVTDAAVIQQ